MVGHRDLPRTRRASSVCAHASASARHHSGRL